MRTLAFTFLTCVSIIGDANANNTRFLPGDAFFFTRLGQANSNSLLETESPEFYYGNHRDAAAGCGYIGYTRLKINNMPRKARGAIGNAYKLLRDQIEEDALGKKRISVFICNRDYDWKKHGLGLQYNENWFDESVAFGVDKDHARLESFFSHASDVAQNWRDSKEVGRLNAVCPQLPKGHTQAWTKTPAKIEWKDCQLLIIPNRKFDDYLSPTNDVEIIQIVGNDLNHLVCNNSTWEPK